MARQGADYEPVAGLAHVGQLGQVVEVDQLRRPGQPHVHHRAQALAAGDHLGARRRAAASCCKRLLDRRRPAVGKGGGLHRAHVRTAGCCVVCLVEQVQPVQVRPRASRCRPPCAAPSLPTRKNSRVPSTSISRELVGADRQHRNDPALHPLGVGARAAAVRAHVLGADAQHHFAPDVARPRARRSRAAARAQIRPRAEHERRAVRASIAPSRKLIGGLPRNEATNMLRGCS